MDTSIRGRIALDGLHLPRQASWRQAFEAELLTFPAGRHDDQVDALGLVGQLLNQIICGRAPLVKKPVRRDGYAQEPQEVDPRGAMTLKMY